jgi:hypothetical protein
VDLVRAPDGEREGEAAATVLAMQAHDLGDDGPWGAVQQLSATAAADAKQPLVFRLDRTIRGPGGRR